MAVVPSTLMKQRGLELHKLCRCCRQLCSVAVLLPLQPWDAASCAHPTRMFWILLGQVVADGLHAVNFVSRPSDDQEL